MAKMPKLRSDGKSKILLATVAFAFVAASLTALPSATVQALDEPEAWYLADVGEEYEFPITPESNPKDWAKSTTAELIDQLQIPKQVLAEMSTSELVGAVLAYPYFSDYLAFNTPQEGFNVIRQRFGALDELLAREDAASALLDVYQKADLHEVLATDDLPTLRLDFLEMMLAQPEILADSEQTVREDIVEAVVDKWEEKELMFDGAVFGDNTSALITARALVLDDPEFEDIVAEDPSLGKFLDNGNGFFIESEPWEELIEETASEVEKAYELELELPTPEDFVVPSTYELNQSNGNTSAARLGGYGYSVPVMKDQSHGFLQRLMADPSYGHHSSYATTPKGSIVNTLFATREFTSKEISDRDAAIKKNYPNATKVRSASSKYNCHSYAFHNTAVSNDKWIETPGMYTTDGSWKKSASQTLDVNASKPLANRLNQRVVWGAGLAHSGIVISSTQVQSKWGQNGLYKHAPNHSPYTYLNPNHPKEPAQLHYYTGPYYK